MQEYIRKLVLGLRRALLSKRRPNPAPETTTTSDESTAGPSRSDKVEELPSREIPKEELTEPISAETQVTMALETLKIEHVPPTHQVYAAFFRDVTNSDFLHAQLKARNPEFDYALIDASSVISRHHLLSGVFNALIVILDGTLLSQTPHSEIVLSMSTNNNIADAYRRWGIAPGKTKDLIVVKLVISPSSTEADSATQPAAQTPESIWAHLSESIKGRPVPLSDEEISTATDWQKVRKYYSLNNVPVLAKTEGEEAKKKVMETLAVSSMALRTL
ncbi:kinase binding protein CGI-121-domain-containing protein [Podospora aff. communis PSN243]|uniref:EKC/KEOPS complex subunit CGI121 n=1 Tax=Podospora aff. communis PSN243 TaxID=3040156 RepID=A0AAV9G6W2_9PEZI|nr:kinase binding protein CGI-121-domain-containing protein [Podospora aff. communis PSN243]